MKKDRPIQTLARKEKVAKKREYAAKTDMFCFLVVSQLRVKVEKELKFHPERKWRFDYAIPEYKIAIEIDGGLWLDGGGRHNRASGYKGDMEKFNAAASLGWLVLKFTPQQKFLTSTLEIIKETLKYKQHGNMETSSQL